ncbi:diaminopimelate epimerase, partial [Pirellulales bacterium]|nr:diaminopimelate epimerase [Pirellulales bacterium]
LELTLRNGAVEQVCVDMGEPVLEAARIPTLLAGDPPILAPMEVAGQKLAVTCASMGNPHCVIFVDEASDGLVTAAGPQIENNPLFPERTNVEFVEVRTRTRVFQRTWERGSGETMACGTGACATCVAGVLADRTEREITVELLGGELRCQWRATDNRVTMTGPAVEVFAGEWPEEEHLR